MVFRRLNIHLFLTLIFCALIQIEAHSIEKNLAVTIYIAADNDLYEYAKKDLKEISTYLNQNENDVELNLLFDSQIKPISPRMNQKTILD